MYQLCIYFICFNLYRLVNIQQPSITIYSKAVVTRQVIGFLFFFIAIS